MCGIGNSGSAYSIRIAGRTGGNPSDLTITIDLPLDLIVIVRAEVLNGIF